MKQIEYYIESNKKLLEGITKNYEYAKKADNREEMKRLQHDIDIFNYYIKGLQDAKKYIEEDKESE